jgi:hypothetical protein
MLGRPALMNKTQRWTAFAVQLRSARAGSSLLKRS